MPVTVGVLLLGRLVVAVVPRGGPGTLGARPPRSRPAMAHVVGGCRCDSTATGQCSLTEPREQLNPPLERLSIVRLRLWQIRLQTVG